MRLNALPLAVVALALPACGGGDSPTSNTTHTLTTVSVSVASSTVQVGHSVQLTATPRDQNNIAMSATVSWSSSAANIATVTSTGLVSGVGAGNVTITATATAGGVTVSTARQIVVTGGVSNSPVLTSVTISAPATNIAAGATVQLTAVPKDQSGNAVSATIGWTTSDNTKATVSSSGLVSTITAGTVTITVSATAGSATVSNSLQLTVVPEQASVLTTLSVAPGSATMVAGDNLQLSAAPLDQFGTLMSATVTWTTSDAQLATVNAAGVVTAMASGTVTITASATAGGVTLNRAVPITISAFATSADITATLNDTFVPPSVDIARGGIVTWTFLTTHNVTFTSSGSPDDIPDTSGGTVERVFNSVGSFSFVCTLHSGMSGTVTVH